MAKLTLDGSVGLQKLQQFAEEAGDKSIRMKMEDGVKVLYTSDKPNSGIKNFFTGQTDRRQQRALTELRTLLSGFQRDAGNTGAQIDDSILTFLPDRGKIKGGDLVNIVKETRDDARMANEALSGGAIACYAFESRDPEAMNSLVSRVTAKLQEKIDNCQNEEQKNILRNGFAVNNGTVAKNAILNLMAQVEGGHIQPGTTYETATPELKQFLDDVYNLSLAGIGGHRCLDPQGNEIEFKGVKYIRVTPGEGQGGFGVVDIYKREGGEERIAVKRPIIDQQDTPKTKGEKFNAYLKEYREHLRLNGDPNVVGLRGMLRGPQGEPLIVLDCAPHGSIYKAQQNLHDSNGSENAKLTVALTLLQDMAKGLNKAHKEGVVHIDVKGPNYLIGEDGKALLCDMGTSGGQVEQRTLEDGTVVTGARILFDKNEIDNPIWAAPELIFERTRVEGIQGVISGLVEGKVDDARRDLEALGFTGKELDDLLQDVRVSNQAKIEQRFGRRQYELTEKSDVWSFGMCAFQLLFNEEQPQKLYSSFMSQIGRKLTDFATDKTNRIFVAPEGEQLTPEQDFINWIMHPDPDQRPSMQEILDHPIFMRMGVGSDLAYGVIKSLKDTTPPGKTRLNNNLQALQGLTG